MFESLRTRWWRYRAWLSIPSLIARADERTVVALVAGANGGLAILCISLVAWASDLPLIFPIIGPTAFLLFTVPFSKAAAPRSIILGHFTALAIGYACWHLTTYATGEDISLRVGGWPLICCAALALAASSTVLIWLSCPHPPACASALVIALGAITSWPEVLAMAACVVLVTGQAVVVNRIACVPVPLWSPRPEFTDGCDA
ncbi:MAG: HPP family protein [Phycisphaerae bacterium]